MILYLSTSASVLNRIPHEDFVPFAGDAGFKGVEFSFSQYDVDLFAELFKEQLSKYGMGSTLHFFHGKSRIGLMDCTNRDYAGEYLSVMRRRAFPAAKILNPAVFIIHPGERPDSGEKKQGHLSANERERLLELNISAFRSIIPDLEELNLTACLENMPGWDFGNDPFDVDRIIREIDSPFFRMCMDVGHYAVSEYFNETKKPVSEIIRELRPNHFHAVDNPPGMKDRHFVLGEGCLDLEDFIEGLNSINYDRIITFEQRTVEDGLKSKENFEKMFSIENRVSAGEHIA
ncbi:MAG: sugar phosphate isomerase/epimerase [Chloroflexi bacterium]|nr:sugar phosphate isomerase/epimerase [Chloroflexota bacterium]